MVCSLHFRIAAQANASLEMQLFVKIGRFTADLQIKACRRLFPFKLCLLFAWFSGPAVAEGKIDSEIKISAALTASASFFL